MTTLLLNAKSFADLFPPEPPTAPMPVEVVRYEGPKPPPPPPEAFESAPRPVLAPSTCRPLAPFPSAPKAPAHPKVKRQGKPTPPMGADPRLPSNVAPHVWANDGLQRRTPAQRRKLMAACPCRLCALALNPPLTFADAARFGLHQPTMSDARAVLAASKWEARAKERVRKSCPACHGSAVVDNLPCSHPECRATEIEGRPDPWKTDLAGPMDRALKAEILAANR